MLFTELIAWNFLRMLLGFLRKFEQIKYSENCLTVSGNWGTFRCQTHNLIPVRLNLNYIPQVLEHTLRKPWGFLVNDQHNTELSARFCWGWSWLQRGVHTWPFHQSCKVQEKWIWENALGVNTVRWTHWGETLTKGDTTNTILILPCLYLASLKLNS